jgi:AAA domain
VNTIELADDDGLYDLEHSPAQSQAAVRLVPIASIASEEVSWLWANRIALGKLNIICGSPDAGKSHLTIAIASRVTNGRRLPGDYRPAEAPASVVFANFEDAAGDTVRPRAERCGVDLERFFVVECANDAGRKIVLSLGLIDHLRDEIRRRGDVAMLVIDPVMGLLSGIRTNSDNDVRSALQPLVDLAEDLRIAVVLVMHLRKAEAESALFRVGGSVGFIGLARTVALVAQAEDGRRAFAPMKNNLAMKASPITFSIGDDGITWGEEADDLSADKLLEAKNSGRPANVRSVAEIWLRNFLAHGPRLATECYEGALKDGISGPTLKRVAANDDLVRKSKTGFQGRWQWALAGSKEDQEF